MPTDPYEALASRYDRMARVDPQRDAFFRDLFARRSVRSVLDCACGTGRDLIAFHRMGLEVEGSDLSSAMLAQARANLARAGIALPLRRVDLRELAATTGARFDAVVCLGNAINELLDDADAIRALREMRALLRPGGIVILDQGQTDASMRYPPRYAPIVNDLDFTRVFVMDYDGTVMTVHVLDFTHTSEEARFDESTVRLRVRLKADWERLSHEAGFRAPEMYGDWGGTPYEIEAAERLIVVATP